MPTRLTPLDVLPPATGRVEHERSVHRRRWAFCSEPKVLWQMDREQRAKLERSSAVLLDKY